MLQNKSDLLANYTYILCDFVTNEVIAEVPFKNVTYGRNIRDAGTFSGSIPVIDDTYNLDLYGNTLPGKTALYILRNNVCVWGGIIWSRTYNIKEKVLEVNASEFISYLHHRAQWADRNNSATADLDFTNGVGTVVVDPQHPMSGAFRVGAKVYINLMDSKTDAAFTGYYTITDDVTPTSTTFSVGNMAINQFGETIGPIEDGPAQIVGITAYVDTYEYARKILNDINVDFFDKADNQYYEAGYPGDINLNYFDDITSITNDGTGKALVHVSSLSGNLTPGQGIKITNTPGFTGEHKVVSVNTTNNTITLDTQAPTGSVTIRNLIGNVTKKQVASIVTAKTSVATQIKHSLYPSVSILTVVDSSNQPVTFTVGDEAVVSGVDVNTDGINPVAYVAKAGEVRFYSVEAPSKAAAASGTVTVKSQVFYADYGPYTAQSDLKIDYSTSEISGKFMQNDPYLGSNLEFMGDILNNYSNTLKGFEYRIDARYDSTTKTFKKTFVIMPYFPAVYTQYLQDNYGGTLPPGNTVPPSALGADKLVFEHPGNIIDLTLEESAEDAATRFWVRGNNSEIDSSSAQPYVAVTAVDMLEEGWPLLDQIESQQTIYDPHKLYEYGKQYLDQARPPISNFSVTVNGSMHPFVGSYVPGDWCSLIVNDDYVNSRLRAGYEAGGRILTPIEPRSSVLVRKIVSYTVNVPDSPSYPEEVTLQLITEPQVDVLGYTAQ